MANNCWNNVIIEGKPEVLAKLEVLFNDYENHDYLVEWGNTFFPNKEDLPTSTIDHLFYDTKWWEFTCEMISDTTLQISGDSAWGPPEKLISMISEHYAVRCEITFAESGMDFAGKCIWENGECIDRIDQSYAEYIYDEGGIDNLITEYLYDDNCFEYYPTPQSFVSSMNINIVSEELDILTNFYKENFKMNKKAILNQLEEIKKHLENLEMQGLAKKVIHCIDSLNIEWVEELKKEVNETCD